MIRITRKGQLTDEIKNLLLPFNLKRIKINATIESHIKVLVDRHVYVPYYEYYIKLQDVNIDINGELKPLCIEITIPYNKHTSKFSKILKGSNVEFFIKIEVIDRDLYAERPTRIL